MPTPTAGLATHATLPRPRICLVQARTWRRLRARACTTPSHSQVRGWVGVGSQIPSPSQAEAGTAQGDLNTPIPIPLPQITCSTGASQPPTCTDLPTHSPALLPPPCVNSAGALRLRAGAACPPTHSLALIYPPTHPPMPAALEHRAIDYASEPLLFDAPLRQRLLGELAGLGAAVEAAFDGVPQVR